MASAGVEELVIVENTMEQNLQLKDFMLEEWNNIRSYISKKLVHSMFKGLKSVMKINGS